MNTKTRSSEIARRAVQTISTSLVGSIDPAVVHFLYRETERLRPNEFILSTDETDTEDTYWEQTVINSVGVIGGFEARIDDDLKITVYAFRRSYLKG